VLISRGLHTDLSCSPYIGEFDCAIEGKFVVYGSNRTQSIFISALGLLGLTVSM
jgi:hypothetical protein